MTLAWSKDVLRVIFSGLPCEDMVPLVLLIFHCVLVMDKICIFLCKIGCSALKLFFDSASELIYEMQ